MFQRGTQPSIRQPALFLRQVGRERHIEAHAIAVVYWRAVDTAMVMNPSHLPRAAGEPYGWHPACQLAMSSESQIGRHRGSLMVFIREPIVHSIAIGDLRPTQITIEMREVEASARRGAPRRATRARNSSGGT
jgi:hypothetical protein